jgi:hypothetical protein
LAPKTLDRYRLAVKEFITWTDGAAWPDSIEQFDELCGDFIEALWEDGHNRGSAADFLSGIQHALPWCRGNLKHSWRLYSTWSKMEPPARAVPMTADILRGFAGLAWKQGDVGESLAMLIGYQGLLRTGEITKLKKRDWTWIPSRKLALLLLGDTKGGKRRGEQETISIDDPTLCQLVNAYLARRQDHDTICGRSGPSFRSWFRRLVQSTALGRQVAYKPYSIRRGAATDFFQRTRNLDALAARGRWANVQTARIYVEEAGAEAAEIYITKRDKLLFADWSRCIGNRKVRPRVRASLPAVRRSRPSGRRK